MSTPLFLAPTSPRIVNQYRSSPSIFPFDIVHNFFQNTMEIWASEKTNERHAKTNEERKHIQHRRESKHNKCQPSYEKINTATSQTEKHSNVQCHVNPLANQRRSREVCALTKQIFWEISTTYLVNIDKQIDKCRGGSRYVEGVPWCFLEISKIQKFDRPKIARFHNSPSIIQKVSRSFQTYFRFIDLIVFTYVLKVFGISKIYQDSTILFVPFLFKTIEIKDGFGPTKIYFRKVYSFLVSHTFRNFEHVGFPKCCDM